jgi:serine phosphatase RsbU (regulator of sigma subunit)
MKLLFYFRKSLINRVLFALILVSSLSLFAQNISKLESQLQNSEGDEKAKVQLELGQAYLQNDPTKSISYASDALSHAKDNGISSIQSYANLLLGQAYFVKKEYAKAYSFAIETVGYFRVNDPENFYTVKGLLGDISFEQKNYRLTVTHLEKAFEYYDKENDHKNAGFVASKMGSSYEKLDNFNQATKWHKKAFDHFNQSKNIREMIVTKSILGGVYSNYGDYWSAKIALNTAYDLAITHGLISEFKTLEERLRIVTKNAKSQKYATTDFERDQDESQNEKFSQALSQRAKTLEEIEKLSEEKQLVELKIRVQQDEYEKSILAERLAKIEIEEALKQEKLEKKNLKLALDNEKLLSDNKSIENQRLFISIGALLLTIVLILLALMIKSRSNRKLAQKNREIERQKAEIEKKQDNINQSIIYATRIQEAILPSSKKMLNNFSDAFVYLNPKDQVSGDFVWTYKLGSKLFVCVADCTGHGVPGAFMSIIFNNILDEIIKKEEVEDPGKVLELASSMLYEKVKEQGRDLTSFKDGMDAVFMTIDTNDNSALYCGAKNSLIMIRENKLEEFKGVRRSIDISSKENLNTKPFVSKKIDIQSNDIFYLSSDGFVDQKGGTNNTKFYPKPFRKLLLEISNKDMNSQKEIVHQTFKDWSANAEQVDDVLVVGFKI